MAESHEGAGIENTLGSSTVDKTQEEPFGGKAEH